MLQPELFSKRSQDLDPAFDHAGHFYRGRPQAWLHAANLLKGNKPLRLPRWHVQVIHTEDDWSRAELIRQGLAKEVVGS